MDITDLVPQLQQSIRRGRILSSPAQLAGYDTDGLGYKRYRPDAVVIPADADELVSLMRSSRLLEVPVTIRGAGTSLSGGPVAAQGGVIVHTSSLKAIRKICPEGFWCEVECSVTLNQLDEALKPFGLFYPPDPSSGPVCTLGGNVAMNAGGAHCFRYGVTSNYVLGVEVVMLDGCVHQFGGPAGGRGPWREDWKRLMVGSEGTLGAFTRFWLRLLPRAEKAWSFRATFPDLATAEKAVHGLVVHPSFPVAIELMDPRFVAMVENSPMACGLPKDAFLIVTEIEGPAVLVDQRVKSVARLLSEAGALTVEYGDDEGDRQRLWRARKVAGGLMGQMSPDLIVQDTVIPKSALAELLQLVYDEADAAGVPVINVFHAGDGNLHPNFLFDSRQPGELERVEEISRRLMERVVAVGGTLSGEHGIGNDKAKYMPLVFGKDLLQLQLAVPRAFNPQHQLNPMKVFSGRRFEPRAAGRRESSHSNAMCKAEPAKSPLTTRDDKTRLFTPFLDTVDGVTCVTADARGGDLEAIRQRDRLRFPLLLDRQSKLKDQILSTEYAPASSRFGPYCDNIIGMNWKLPTGRIIRLGERVVKSTTGYDLMRFMLQSGGRFGEPIDFVIRLRPDCGRHGVFLLRGDIEPLRNAITRLLQTCWMNWFESVDYLLSSGHTQGVIRIMINTPAEDWSVFEEMLISFARENHLHLEATADEDALDGCPDVMLKTTPDHAIALAEEITATENISCVVLCYNGVVHGYCNHQTDRAHRWEQVQALIRRYESRLAERGGDWRSPHLSRPFGPEVEATWLKALSAEFEAP